MTNDYNLLGRKPQVTLKEVAQRAGVSQMTVSRVINAPDMVRKPTRDRVRAAIRELNYRPNLMARSLAAGRALFIGITYNNPSRGYLSEVLLGALKSCRSMGHHLVVEELSDDEVAEPQTVAERIRDSGLDGVILVPPLSECEDMHRALTEHGVPFVLLTPGANPGAAPCVVIDDRAAAREMTCRLIELGHTRIGFVTGPPGDYQTAERREGYRSALAEAGIDADDRLTAVGAFTYRSGMEAGEALLSADTPPTAIFAANDDMAAGVMAAAMRLGRRVPEELSVVGFDDTDIATTVWPQLTTVRQPIADMAAMAVQLLGGDIAAYAEPRVSMKVTFTERGTTAPPHKG